jgi:hypothetical protein
MQRAVSQTKCRQLRELRQAPLWELPLPLHTLPQKLLPQLPYRKHCGSQLRVHMLQ